MLWLIADGGCKGNHKTGTRYGYGSYMILDGSSLDSASVLKHTTFNSTAHPQTNNVAEYTALIKGLKSLIERTNDFSRVTVIMDSQLILKQVGGFWKVTKPHLGPLRDKARELLSEFEETALKWVPRSVVESYLGH